MKFVLAFVMLIIGISATLAQSPVQVTADTFVVDQKTNQATFTGSVVVTRSDLTLWADKVLVDFQGGMDNIKLITATGSVRLKTDSQDATSQRATFVPDSQILRLSGNVTVVNDSGTLKGPELVVDLENNVTTFSGSDGGRVTGVFSP